jgi:UDP-perosamine 4-acetyltransferase
MIPEALDSAWHDMTVSRVAVIGAGGHAAVVIEALRAQRMFMILGVIDSHSAHSNVLGVQMLGGDDCLPGLRRDGIDAAVVAIGDNRLRQKNGQTLIAQGYRRPPVIHPLASLSPSAFIACPARRCTGGQCVGERSLIAVGSSVRPSVRIGADVTVGARSAAVADIADGVDVAGAPARRLNGPKVFQ